LTSDTLDAGNPQLGSMVTLAVSAGTTYVVDGYGQQSGKFELTVVPPVAAPLP